MLNVVNKKGMASFGTIVAVIGSILIFIGVAWIIAQNWHIFSSAVKIIILVFFTCAAFASGVMARLKGYGGTAKALFVLGALLYTSSIFLIAQIFHTDVSFQGTAWLFLPAWAGVLFTAYILPSAINLVLALVEFLVWLCLQYFAFMDNGFEFSFVYLSFILLAVGVFFFGLYLLHKYRQHAFARLYQFWAAFYFLLYSYLLSFQLILSVLWIEGMDAGGGVMGFFTVVAIVAIIIFILGVMLAKKSDRQNQREIYYFLGIVVLLLAVIGVSKLGSNEIGECRPVNCYEYNGANECRQASICEWRNISNGDCVQKNCYNIDSQGACEGSGCKWTNPNAAPAQQQSTTSSLCSKSVRGKFGYALEFSNTGKSYLIKEAPSGLPTTGDKTLALWFKFPESYQSSPCTLGGFGANKDGENFQIEACDSSQFGVLGWNKNRDWFTMASSQQYKDNQWHNVAVTYESGITLTTLYLDGKFRSRTPSYAYNTTPERVVIGNEIDLEGRAFRGSVDDFAIWGRALTASEVLDLFSNSFTNESLKKDLAIHLSFEDAEGAVNFADSSGHGNILSCVQTQTIPTSAISPGKGYCSDTYGGAAISSIRQEYNTVSDKCRSSTTRSTCTSDRNCSWEAEYYGAWSRSSMSFALWVIWIFSNLVFLGVILGIIFYGTWQRLPKLVNLGIFSFALFIITRYIGFMMDLRGYLSLSLIFIIGGIILLAGGWFIERWRRKLIREIKDRDKPRDSGLANENPVESPQPPKQGA